MRVRPRAFGFAEASIALLGAVVAVAGCTGATAPAPEAESAPPPPPLLMEDVRLSYSERGAVQHVLVARHLTRTGTEGKEKATDFIEVDGGFTLYLGGDEHEHSSTLTALRGTLDEASLRLVAEDDVVLENAAGDRLETEYLVWNEDSNRVYTNRAVTIYTEDGVLHGQGLESDGRFERYRILQPTGELTVPDPR